MKRLNFILLILLSVFFANAQNTIIVQSDTQASVYTSLDSAVAAAPAGAYIYLSGGRYNLKTDLDIDKELHIIGAGHYPDSTVATNRTIITGEDIRFLTGADNSSIEGVYFDGVHIGLFTREENNSVITGLIFKRIYSGRGLYMFYENYTTNGTIVAKNSLIKDCIVSIISGGVSSYSSRSIFPENIVISNNIFDKFIQS